MMPAISPPAVNPNEFLTAFNGSFAGILHWPQLDNLWNVLRQDTGGQFSKRSRRELCQCGTYRQPPVYFR